MNGSTQQAQQPVTEAKPRRTSYLSTPSMLASEAALKGLIDRQPGNIEEITSCSN